MNNDIFNEINTKVSDSSNMSSVSNNSNILNTITVGVIGFCIGFGVVLLNSIKKAPTISSKYKDKINDISDYKFHQYNNKEELFKKNN